MDRSKKHKSVKGQGMVEFALVLPILMVLVVGIIEVGHLIFIYASVATSSRQAARYGSTTGVTEAGALHYRDCAGIREAAKQVGFLSPIQDSDIVIKYDHGPGTAIYDTCNGSIDNFVNVQGGDRIEVSVTVMYAPIIPLLPIDSFPITSISYRTLLGSVYLP